MPEAPTEQFERDPLAEGDLCNSEAPPIAWRADSLANSVAILLTLTAVQRLVGFVRAILFCRWLKEDQLGLWDMAFGFLMLAGPFVVLAVPGTFGRYAEYFRERGRLRAMMFQAAVVCAALTALAVTIILLRPDWFSELIFGDPAWSRLIPTVAVSLLFIVAYNYWLSLATSLRRVRVAAIMEFFNGVLFAVIGVALLQFWRCDAQAAIVAYGCAGILCVIGGSTALRGALREKSNSPTLAETAFAKPESVWRKLAPFAAWMLAISLLTNLFGIADRYMILHFTPGEPDALLAIVGQYHSARVVPLLLVSIASTLSAMLLPHLSRDWESGDNDRASWRLNAFLKLFVLGLLIVSTVILFAAPLVFQTAFRGKFAAGLSVLPWTLAYCVWLSAALLAQQYLWCVEKAGWVALAMLVGLAVNVIVNILLLPTYKLQGAVLAATAANLTTLTLILLFSRAKGFKFDRGLIALLAAAPALALGPWSATAVLIVYAWAALRGKALFTESERELIAAQLAKALKLADRLASKSPFLKKMLDRFGGGKLSAT